MLIKFLLSCSIRSLCNTIHNNKQFVPITGYRRQLITQGQIDLFTRSPPTFPLD